jgi:hypothetical protein
MKPQGRFAVAGVLAIAFVVLAVKFWPRRQEPKAGPEVVPGPADQSEADKMARQAAAAFLRGDYRDGYAKMDTLGQLPLTELLRNDMGKLLDRVNGALSKAHEAQRLFNLGEHEKAAKLMHEAAQEYPEAKDLHLGADYFEGYAAFDRKDYALYLQLAQKSAATAPDNIAMIIWLANAQAASYAVSGDPALKEAATATLAKADAMASSNPASKPDFDHMAKRIRYRIDSRQIVSAEEYDRRVQTGQIR